MEPVLELVLRLSSVTQCPGSRSGPLFFVNFADLVLHKIRSFYAIGKSGYVQDTKLPESHRKVGTNQKVVNRALQYCNSFV